MKIPESRREEFEAILQKACYQLSVLVGKKVIVDVRMEKVSEKDQFIRGVVCDEFGIPWGDIIKRCKREPIVSARQSYCYLSNKFENKQPPEIAVAINRERTTPISAIHRVNDALWANDPILKPAIDRMELKIRNYEATVKL